MPVVSELLYLGHHVLQVVIPDAVVPGDTFLATWMPSHRPTRVEMQGCHNKVRFGWGQKPLHAIRSIWGSSLNDYTRVATLQYGSIYYG